MERNNEAENRGTPQDNPSKAMDSKKEVEQSKDEKTDQDFPGYPHYPAKEDIMDKRTDSHRVDVDVENMGRNAAARFTGEPQRQPPAAEPQDDLDIKMGTDADVDEDDLAVLNATDAEIGTPQNVSNEDLETDLDSPGSELDDAAEEIGEEDEENNYYSLGGDRHESQEEDPYSGPQRGE